ncbi:MAG: hypothetical protein SF069_00575 [Phycisphaerae bacterium]|nr:hypothetical protein [Phycisphaerae bacterium]
MCNTAPLRNVRLALLGLVLPLVGGCPDGGGGGGMSLNPPLATDAESALRRINDNLNLLNEKIEADTVVTVRFVDRDGQKRQFVGHEGKLRFMAPQCLRFDIRGLDPVIAQFGSNDDRYWVWVKPELNTLWWGEWSNAGFADDLDMPVPPQRLLDALMIRPLPTEIDGRVPLNDRDGAGRKLVYRREDGSIAREVRLDRSASGMPFEIIDRAADGRTILMIAKLKKYARIGSRGPFVPRVYEVSWPQNQGEMVLRIKSIQFKPTLPDWFCEFPEKWGGETRQLGQTAASRRPPGDGDWPEREEAPATDQLPPIPTEAPPATEAPYQSDAPAESQPPAQPPEGEELPPLPAPPER